MPNPITTIDFFDNNMVDAIKQLLREYEKDISDFESSDKLMDFVWGARKDFGNVVYELMINYMTEDEWFTKVHDAT